VSIDYATKKDYSNLDNDEKECKLYKEFKNLCRVFNCPEPDDEMDKPSNYRPAHLLDILHGHVDEVKDRMTPLPVGKVHWQEKINQMKYDDKINTYFRLSYFLNKFDKFRLPKEVALSREDFFKWFRLDHASLIPYWCIDNLNEVTK
jgi:hypothetical protein